MIPKRRKEKGNSNIELQWSIQSTTLYRTKSKRGFSSQRLIYSHIKQQVILNVVSYNVKREGKTDKVERENKAQTSHIQLRKLYEMFIEMKLSFSTLPRFWYHRPIPLSSSIPTANNVSNRNTYRFYTSINLWKCMRTDRFTLFQFESRFDFMLAPYNIEMDAPIVLENTLAMMTI